MDAADDGGSAVNIGYVLQSKTRSKPDIRLLYDHCGQPASEIWWNTLDCQMMNAEIPDQTVELRRLRRWTPTDHDIDAYERDTLTLHGVSAEATTVVATGTVRRRVRHDFGHQPLRHVASWPMTTYYYRVSAINSVGKGEYSDGMAMDIMVTIELRPTWPPWPAHAVADQMVYVGAMVEVQSNFSDPDEDMLSYMASSSDDDGRRHRHGGLDMGMVTITGVAEGMATITVTASDPMGAYAMQTIMVTVMMMPPGEGEMMTLASNVVGSYLAAVNTFGVTWTPAADAQQQYVVLASLADGYSVVDVKVLGADASSHEFTVEDDRRRLRYLRSHLHRRRVLL